MFGHDDTTATDTTMPTEPATASEPATPLPTPGVDAADATDVTDTAAAPASDPTATPFLTDSEPATADTAGSADGSTAAVVNNDLLDIKQQALQQLSPLVGHLNQSPEEKFRTTMMMIQASDDQALLKTAYEAAQSISDEKTRAQALLDIINEINYFTQQPQANNPASA